MKKISCLLLFYCCSFGGIKAQLIESGILVGKIESIIASMPGSGGQNYVEPNPSQLDTWNNTMVYLLAGNFAEATVEASLVDYDLIKFTDTPSGKTYYILASNNINYWGTYVYNPESLLPLVIQSPHPKYDTNTGVEGIFVFKEIDALFFSMNGTHRCNQATETTCSGTTSACGTSGPYKISDMAHNTNSVFQLVTERLFTDIDSTYFVSLHGFAKRDSDPYVILSNGTRDMPETDYISRFKTRLQQEDKSLTFQIAHINTGWTRLIGFTNTQGRLINDSVDPCSTNASSVTGRFMHMEQEKTKLRSDENGWRKVANALKSTFTDPITGIIITDKSSSKPMVYPNPSSGQITITGLLDKPKEIKIYSLLNRDLSSFVEVEFSNKNTKLDLSRLPPGLYILKTNSNSQKIFIQ